MADARTRFGIQIKHSKLGRMHRVQEWFIPWSELGGGGGTEEPAVGTHFGFSIAYNDRDGQPQSKRLRWIDKKGPWRSSAEKGTAPRGWGDLVIGPTQGDPAPTASR